MKKANRIYYRGGVGQTASTLRGGGDHYVDSSVAVTARIDGSGHQPHRHAASGNSGLYPGGGVLRRYCLGARMAGPFVSERDSYRRPPGAGDQCDRGVVSYLYTDYADYAGSLLVRGADRVLGWPGGIWRIV